MIIYERRRRRRRREGASERSGIVSGQKKKTHTYVYVRWKHVIYPNFESVIIGYILAIASDTGVTLHMFVGHLKLATGYINHIQKRREPGRGPIRGGGIQWELPHIGLSVSYCMCLLGGSNSPKNKRCFVTLPCNFEEANINYNLVFWLNFREKTINGLIPEGIPGGSLKEARISLTQDLKLALEGLI